MRTHTEDGDVSQVEKLVEMMKSSASAKTPTKKSTAKRDLSVSPEIVNLEKKLLKKIIVKNLRASYFWAIYYLLLHRQLVFLLTKIL